MSIWNPFSRLTFSFLLVFLALVATVFLFRVASPFATFSSPQVMQARLAPGTECLTKQAALHISKMTGGDSVGGLPPFRPPDDDEKYKQKIKDRSFTPEEANYWIKELANFLEQMANKNGGITLREILLRQGLNNAQTDNFLTSLLDVYRTTEGMSGHGVTIQTFERFSAVLIKLGVLP